MSKRGRGKAHAGAHEAKSVPEKGVTAQTDAPNRGGAPGGGGDELPQRPQRPLRPPLIRGPAAWLALAGVTVLVAVITVMAWPRRHFDMVKALASFAEHEGVPGFTSPVAYPTAGGEFPARLAALAAMLADESLPIKCVSLTAVGSYDTHSDEAETLSTNLGETVASVLAFQRDLEARKLDDRVLIQLWSEFGRRPRENGSGTDHGAGGVAFLIGSRVKGQMVGEYPGLAKLDPNENLVNTSDFRAMYAGLLGQWFQTEAGLVIPEAGSGLAGPSPYGTIPQLIA